MFRCFTHFGSETVLDIVRVITIHLKLATVVARKNSVIKRKQHMVAKIRRNVADFYAPPRRRCMAIVLVLRNVRKKFLKILVQIE